jgi:hypothetical protein
MAQWNIHFDNNGEIKQIDNSPAPEKIGDLNHISIECSAIPSIHSLTHKVVNGVLTERTDEEKKVALIPTPFEVKAAIYSELCSTDEMIVSDRPSLVDWKPYRQTLRDLSKLAGPVEMITAWPVRPDGVDVVVGLRGRVPA